MRFIRIVNVIFLCVGVVMAQDAVSPDDERSSLVNIIHRDMSSTSAMLKALKKPKAYEPIFIEPIQRAIALNDAEVNNELVNFLFVSLLHYSAMWPTEQPPASHLENLRSIEGMRCFLLAWMHAPDAHPKVFDVIAILYGYDEDVRIEMVKLGMSCSNQRPLVMFAFISGGIQSDIILPLLEGASSSDSVHDIYMTALYLSQDPRPDFLSALVDQYQRPSAELAYVPDDEDLNQQISAGLPAPSILDRTLEERADIVRFSIGQAIASYAVEDLLTHADAIGKASELASFGPMSQRMHDIILGRLNKGAEKE